MMLASNQSAKRLEGLLAAQRRQGLNADSNPAAVSFDKTDGSYSWSKQA